MTRDQALNLVIYLHDPKTHAVLVKISVALIKHHGQSEGGERLCFSL